MIDASLQQKLEQLVERYDELAALLSSSDVIADQARFRELSKEYSRLEALVGCYKALQAKEHAIEQNKLLLQDAELAELAALELESDEKEAAVLVKQLKILLLPQDPDDQRDVFLEIRAGAGGDEAAIFAGDLFRMYERYAESRGWQVAVLSTSLSDQGGYKEIISRISGTDVYRYLKFESGAHRVQRVPETESQGRIHTSACTVAVMPEIDEIEAIDIKTDELRIDTFRASGAGGQHVNKTDSAIRITHLPTGIVVECQQERSQHKNKTKALSLLQSKLLSQQKDKQQLEQADLRRSLVGSGDRSERIRTYNYPQGRVTDHRINLTLYKLDEVMSGQLDAVITPSTETQQINDLTAMGISY